MSHSTAKVILGTGPELCHLWESNCSELLRLIQASRSPHHSISPHV